MIDARFYFKSLPSEACEVLTPVGWPSLLKERPATLSVLLWLMKITKEL